MESVDVVDDIEKQLRAAGDRERAEGQRRYLKSDLEHVGVPVPVVRRIAAAAHGRCRPTRMELRQLATGLWRPVHELRLAAVELMRCGVEQLDLRDRALLERLLREAGTWALVDPLAIHVVGVLRGRSPTRWRPELKVWATAPDLWLRRSALLAHLEGLRTDDAADASATFALFAELADPQLADREFFVRKAIGWVLRDTGRRHPALVRDWLEPRAHRAAGLTVREAVRHLPEDARDGVLAAARRAADR